MVLISYLDKSLLFILVGILSFLISLKARGTASESSSYYSSSFQNNEEASLEGLIKAANQGDALAQNNLGIMYDNGA